MKALKWIGIGIGSLIGLIIAAAIVVPLVVDVDKYRPQILDAANQQINGKVELGKLSLSLWGQIRVQVDGLDVKDSAGRSVVSVKDAYFHLPFLSVLSGSPEMIFKMTNPAVNLIKYKNGKLNAMNLMKPSAPPAGGSPTVSGGAQQVQPGGSTQLPAIATRARLGIEMRNAMIDYVDEGTGLKSQVKDLNLIMRNISLSQQMTLELWADLDTVMGKTLAVKGPARMEMHFKPTINNGAFEQATIDAKIDLDGLDIASGEMFHKSKGMAANLDFAATASPKDAKIERLVVKFFNAEIKTAGTVSNLGAQPSTPGGVAPSPVVNVTVASNEIDFKPWNQLVPMLKDFDLAGSAKLDAQAQGPADKLGYKAKFGIKNLTAKAPKLKTQPRFDLDVAVATDELQSLIFTMKAPGNDLKVTGKLVNFAKPQGGFEITSTGMDLDQLVDWPPPAPKAAAPAAGAPAGGPAGAGGRTAAAEDVDASLDSLRANPTAAAAAVTMGFNIKMLQAQKIRMDDLVGRFYFKNLTAGLEGFGLKIWNGTIKSNFAAQLKPKQPTYTFNFVMDGLDLNKAVEANVQAVKNTLVGRLHFDIGGAGTSFNTEPAKGNLKAKGSFKVDDAKFATVDVTKMASEGINKALAKVAEKVPQAKGKQVGTPGGRESKYEWIASNFTIDGGKFKMPDFATKAAPNQGIDLKGNTEVGLKDYALATTWEVIDTFNLTKARDLSVDVAGEHIEHLLAEGNNPVKFTVHAGCNCMAPCYSYTEVPEQLAAVAARNVAGVAEAKAKAELAKRVQQVVPKSAPPAVQNAIQGFGKKFR